MLAEVGVPGTFAPVLARQVGDVADRSNRQRGVHEATGDEAVIAGLPAHPLHPLRAPEFSRRHLRRPSLQQRATDIVQAFGRDAARRVPERFEVRRHGACLRAGHQHVAVAEVVFAVPVVIVVLVIASTHHADRIVDDQQLVVHALVEAAEAAQHAAGVIEIVQPRLAEGGVVHAQLQVLVRRGEGAEDLQIGNGRKLVDQHPYLHATPAGGKQFIEHQPRTVVLVEDIGLQIDAAGGAAQQVQPRHQRFFALIEDDGIVAWAIGHRFAEGTAGQCPQWRILRASIGLRAVDHAGTGLRGDARRTRALAAGQRRTTADQQQRCQQHQADQQIHGFGASLRRARSTKVTRSLRASCQLSMP